MRVSDGARISIASHVTDVSVMESKENFTTACACERQAFPACEGYMVAAAVNVKRGRCAP